MKYIIYIILIACVATLSFFSSSTPPDSKKDSAVWVDGRSISVQEVATLKRRSPSLFTATSKLPESLIMREVLINEALRQKVDKDESFRQRIKTFYEQSLVKILVERKMDSIQYEPTPEELSGYANLLGRRIELDLIPVVADADRGIEHLAGPFLDFSVAIRVELIFVKPGETSKPFKLFGKNYRLAVKKISEKDPQFAGYNSKRVRAVIREYRREQLFATWQESLMKQAEIVVAPSDGGQRH